MSRDAHSSLPFGAVRLQAFCRRRRGDLTYLGRSGNKLRVAATLAGQKALAAEFVIELTGETKDDKAVVTVRAKV